MKSTYQNFMTEREAVEYDIHILLDIVDYAKSYKTGSNSPLLRWKYGDILEIAEHYHSLMYESSVRESAEKIIRTYSLLQEFSITRESLIAPTLELVENLKRYSEKI